MSECANEWMRAAEQTNEWQVRANGRASEWPSTDVLILGCYEPWWSARPSNFPLAQCVGFLGVTLGAKIESSHRSRNRPGWLDDYRRNDLPLTTLKWIVKCLHDVAIGYTLQNRLTELSLPKFANLSQIAHSIKVSRRRFCIQWKNLSENYQISIMFTNRFLMGVINSIPAWNVTYIHWSVL